MHKKKNIFSLLGTLEQNIYIYTIYLQNSIRWRQINGKMTPNRSQKFRRTCKGDQKCWIFWAHSTRDTKKHELLVSLSVHKGKVSKLGQGRKTWTYQRTISKKIKRYRMIWKRLGNQKHFFNKDLLIKSLSDTQI